MKRAVQTLSGAATTMGRMECETPERPATSGSRQPSEREAIERYFASPLSSYPLLHEMPLDMLVEEARKCGIPTDGREKRDIAADIFLGTGE